MSTEDGDRLLFGTDSAALEASVTHRLWAQVYIVQELDTCHTYFLISGTETLGGVPS